MKRSTCSALSSWILCCSITTLATTTEENSCGLVNGSGFRGRVIVVTAGVENEQAAELIRSGISGIFMKHHSATLLVQGIRDVLAGKVWFDQALLREAVHSGGQESFARQFTDRE